MFNRKVRNDSCSAEKSVNANVNEREAEERRELKVNLEKIDHKIVVLSGKGGVGKSTVAVNLAISLSQKGFRVGLLDIDIHGPSIPKLLGLEEERLYADETGKLIPVVYGESMKVISIGLLIGKGDDAVIWRGPLKYSAIKQFLKDVEWGELDYLIIDSPPGTGDEPLSVCQLIENPDGAIVVTTPQDLAIIDVRKSITFCNKLNMPVLGVIENMSGFVCPHCGSRADIFKSGGGRKMSEDMGVPFLGSIPVETDISEMGDSGKPFISMNSDNKTEAGKAFEEIVNKITKMEVECENCNTCSRE
ncbi:MAG: Mrp/NBP35 family ATP-binding protein [Spirochaetota bacterium]|nr:Mrp/NBP35 family ATP-binding protein [Spirochaetota bacterium]